MSIETAYRYCNPIYYSKTLLTSSLTGITKCFFYMEIGRETEFRPVITNTSMKCNKAVLIGWEKWTSFSKFSSLEIWKKKPWHLAGHISPFLCLPLFRNVWDCLDTYKMFKSLTLYGRPSDPSTTSKPLGSQSIILSSWQLYLLWTSLGVSDPYSGAS